MPVLSMWEGKLQVAVFGSVRGGKTKEDAGGIEVHGAW